MIVKQVTMIVRRLKRCGGRIAGAFCCIILATELRPCRAEEQTPADPPWLGNTIGISDDPPSPFTPMRLEGANTILCWNRRYEIGSFGLPDRIVSGGRELLAAPARLNVRTLVDGRVQPVSWTPRPIRQLEASRVRIRLAGAADSPLGVCEWVCTAEFDGMIRLDITLTPRSEMPIAVLEARFPVNRRHATLYRLLKRPGPSGARHKRSGSMTRVRQLRQEFWATSQPYWWIGDEDGGLAGFCETDEAWDQVGRQNSFFVKNEYDSSVVVWRPIDAVSKTVLKGPWKWTFGLQATPVKAVPPRGRYRVFAQGVGNVKAMFWTFPEWAHYFGFPAVLNPEPFGEAVALFQRDGVMTAPYSCLTMVSEKVPEWKQFREQWHDGGRRKDFTDNQVRSFGVPFVGVLPAPSWIDFIVWSNHRFVRENDVDGLYHDWSGVYPVARPDAGFGYVRDGKNQDVYPFFATRELYKRIYTMLKCYGAEQEKDMFSLIHCSGYVYAPILGFCDGYVVGEKLQKIFRRGRTHYLQLVGPAEMRAEFMGRNYGALPFFLPAQPQVGEATTRELLGLALLHDFSLWAAWCDVDEVNRTYRLLDDFGYGEAEFLPYWRNGAIIGRQTKSVMASAYCREEGGTLICVMNAGKQEQLAVLEVQWDKLKLPGDVTVTDAVRGEPIATHGPRLIVGKIPPYDYRLLHVK